VTEPKYCPLCGCYIPDLTSRCPACCYDDNPRETALMALAQYNPSLSRGSFRLAYKYQEKLDHLYTAKGEGN